MCIRIKPLTECGRSGSHAMKYTIAEAFLWPVMNCILQRYYKKILSLYIWIDVYKRAMHNMTLANNVFPDTSFYMVLKMDKFNLLLNY